MALAIRNVVELEPSVWKARLPPSDLRFLAGNATRLGPVSIVLLTAAASFDHATGTLSFGPTNARVLNLGATDNTIIIESRVSADGDLQTSPAVMALEHAVGGDAGFLAALPSNLVAFGTQLLTTVRAGYPGALKFFQKSGKFVETPDNFWTIRIQARDASFRITVRGRPEDFVSQGTIQLKSDMSGYSNFKLTASSQLNDFIGILQQVPRKGRRT